MKKIMGYLLTLTLIFTLLESCIMTTVVEELENTVAEMANSSTEMANSAADNYPQGNLKIKITNGAPNTLLWIDSLEICNILIKNSTAGTLETGNAHINITDNDRGPHNGNTADTLTSTALPLPVQKFNIWVPAENQPENQPGNSHKMYLKIYGKIETIPENGTTIPLCTGPMYCTFPGTIAENRTTVAHIEFYDNCPIYCITNGVLSKVLQSVQFEAGVGHWGE